MQDRSDAVRRQGKRAIRLGALMVTLAALGTSLSAQQAESDLGRAYFKAAAVSRSVSEEMSFNKKEGESSPRPRRMEASLRAKLEPCSETFRQDFMRSMVFVDGRLASAHVTDIKGCLGEAKYSEVLGFFGVVQSADHDQYWCASRATCSHRKGDICTSNCEYDPGPDPQIQMGALSPAPKDLGYVALSKVLEGYAPSARSEMLERLDFSGPNLQTAYLRAPDGKALDGRSGCEKFNLAGTRAWCPTAGGACERCSN